MINGVDARPSENDDPYVQSSLEDKTFHVMPSLEKVKKIFQSFLARPFIDAPEEITPNEEFVSVISLPATEYSRIAAHTRIGTDMTMKDIVGWTDSRELKDSFFIPRIVAWADELANHHEELLCCRQWLVVARWEETVIQLYSIPLGRLSTDTPYLLTARLELPEGRTVLELGFYGDDGKSSLSSGNDGGTGKDGPYDVAFLCQNMESSVPDLLFVPCSEVGWQAVAIDGLAECEIKGECCFKVVPSLQCDDEDGNSAQSENTILAQSK